MRAAGCGGAALRVADGARPGVERNELTPLQAAGVERELDGLTRRLPPGQRRTGKLSVPVYVHVLHDGRGGPSDAAVKRQIAALNAAYGGRRGGADTGVAFRLVKTTRTRNAAWYRDAERYERTFKRQLRKGGAGTLNLYTAGMADDLLGWSSFPWQYRSEPVLDGVVIHEGTLPGGRVRNYDLGFSAVHEIGHWLGLYHTFQDGCAGQGDRVADTPPQRDPTHGCPGAKDTCRGGGADPFHNYMDYSHDRCMSEFTSGQAARLRKVWAAYRA
ncbi:zinc metalloprotease [Actinomadura flavalba]|uniref:zinc metalloprotease n=1 Tax=Actinomadura flavalba TaxID=1120938 RepID=UPI0012DD6130|nr:zinc metalloprotease [Actinomadura flavalba]